MPNILIVDDEASIRDAIQDILTEEGYKILVANNGEAAFDLIERRKIDLILCDIKMPRMDGIELLSKCNEKGINIPFIMISAHGTIDIAIKATKKGAYDFIQKPPDLNRLLLTIRNALATGRLIEETKFLKKKIANGLEMIGKSDAMVEIKQTIEKVAPTTARVLITGENGTGKELVSKWLHQKSDRYQQPFVEVNCAAIPSELIESELFGHEKGAFTSAHKMRLGKFEQAENGTLFLDEIGDMSLAAQAKVLKALQDHVITRVGGDKPIDINVRVITATNKNLQKEINNNNFRIDLYHRLSVVVIHVPSLRERKNDIPLLINYFLKQIGSEYRVNQKKMEQNAINILTKLPWQGNIRELRNVIERLHIMSNNIITKKDVEKYVTSL